MAFLLLSHRRNSVAFLFYERRIERGMRRWPFQKR
jgi:hypothetical protein